MDCAGSLPRGGLARFDEALRREVGGAGIHVATAYPGATDTGMMACSDAVSHIHGRIHS